MVGGIGSIINLIRPDIRSYTRITPFLLFYTLISFGSLIQAILLNIKINSNKKTFLLALSCVIMSLGVREVRPPPVLFKSEMHVTAQKVNDLLEKIDPHFADKSNIFYLPASGYPSVPNKNAMMGQEDEIPYVLTGKYNWGIAPLLPDAQRYQFLIDNLPARKMTYQLGLDNFQAVWLNKNGYQDSGEKIINEFSQITGITIYQLPDNPNVMIDIRKAFTVMKNLPEGDIVKLTPGYVANNEKILCDLVNDGIFLAFYPAGWHLGEPEGRWTSENSSIKIRLDSCRLKHIVLSIGNVVIPRRFQIAFGEYLSDEFTIETPGDYNVPINNAISKRGPTTITFITLNPFVPCEMGFNNDDRKLGIFIKSISFTGDE
jgi:hypothetical protein